ncbi:26S proteasome regulatory subunit rpn-8 [Zancudomyces culisetae]|uniref:26S proteasome regulatory subunit rpn-8 n=1 Tax=Zancudomyces culisetae TaxID=1213189 RepID=A0A1R1PS54_ZANCU|nr:26S proteasome regulatory subunit rpn-8 [Zancudomyces culisetae]|eukprot:OMH83723.1 26S proteasome regulatory subunit rpn-8 [Zancudomyces culisetae]
MRDMFKKVNVKEVLIGWYHSGPKLQAADLQINELFKRYVANPVLVVVDVHPKEVGIPTNAYISIEEIHDDGSAATKTFEHIPSEIGAEEAEEIGVEHLLRDVKDNAIGTLSLRLARQLESIKGLNDRLEKMSVYLDNVVSGKLPVNVDIIYNLQDIFNLIPNLDAAKLSSVFAKKTNDTYMLLYISTMIRAIISLHDLVNNKIQNREAELAQDISQAPNQQNVQPTTPQTDTS